LRARRFGEVLADRADELGIVQEARALLLRGSVADVRVVENLRKRAPALVFADDVGDQALFVPRAGEQERKRIPKEVRKSQGGDCILVPMRRRSTAARFAERTLEGVDDAGVLERVVIWIERKPGAVWGVGRAVNPQLRSSEQSRPDDFIFEGFELEDALEQANATLRDDLRVLEQDGRPQNAAPFERTELLKPLERWFFGRGSGR
jgi:hypothetical protein